MSDEYVTIDDLVEKAVKSQEVDEGEFDQLTEGITKKEQKKLEKEAKKAAKKAARESRDRMTKVKKGIIVAALSIAAIAGTFGFVAHEKLNNVRTALDIQNLTGPTESITATAENIGDIDGFWVAALICVDYKLDEINRLEGVRGEDGKGVYITMDGKDFDNTMNGKPLNVKSTHKASKEEYDGDGYIFPDDERLLISTFSLKDIALKYKISPEISYVEDDKTGEVKDSSLSMTITPKG